MASPGGPRALGTDGSDFNHRQKVASQYQASPLYKARFRFCIFSHFVLFLVLSAKLLEDVLDRLDVFILELEELYIPKPMIWEWMWLSSLLFTFFGLSGARKNKSGSMKIFVLGTVIFGLGPIFFAAIYYAKDMWQYVETRDSSGLQRWQGYPIAVLWYIFLTAAFQMHLFSLYFAIRLLKAWKLRGKKLN